jgi:hypothetical protein
MGGKSKGTNEHRTTFSKRTGEYWLHSLNRNRSWRQRNRKRMNYKRSRTSQIEMII